jgi:hypothetical protein
MFFYCRYNCVSVNYFIANVSYIQNNYKIDSLFYTEILGKRSAEENIVT